MSLRRRPTLRLARSPRALAVVALAGVAGVAVVAMMLLRRSTAQSTCNRGCDSSQRDVNGCCPAAPPAAKPKPAAPPAPPAPPAPACPTGMVGLPGGTFTMGDRADTVTVQPFCMDVTEVTVTSYTGCVTANACAEPDAYVVDDLNLPYKFLRACNWRRPGAGLHPANCVDWGQATSYCAWAQKRLPTEEEWEWAARGASQGRVYPWGSAPPTNADLNWGTEPPHADRVNACGTECVAWGKANLGLTWTAMYLADDGWPTTSPVGSFPRGATAEGLEDMAGNVWEWTSSNYETKARVCRGGGWSSDRSPHELRAASRLWHAPSLRFSDLGFRCAR